MNIGDLVRHKYDGGVGIIVGTRRKHSNVTMGVADWLVIHWLEQENNMNRTVYMPAFLELIGPTDKNCPPKQQIKLDNSASP